MSLTLSSELSASLKANGCNLEGAELDSLFQGILAAPRSVDNSWLQLFGDNLNETACDLLIDARRSAYEEMDAGFTEGPAPAYRLDNLRQAMQEQGIDAFLIPRTDEFLGEYVPEYADRLYWLTGFSGSAGIAIVMQDKAAIFVDGRYTIQVAGEVNDDLFEICHLLNQPPYKWVQDHLSAGQVLGIDPLLHNKRSFDLFKSATDTVSACIKLLSSNPVDQVWQNQPARPIGTVLPHALDYAGQSAEEKIVSISGALKDKNIDEVVITASDSIAWLLNIRGGDVARCPLPLSYLVLSREGKVRLFIDSRKLPHGTKTYLAEKAIECCDFEAFSDHLARDAQSGFSIQVDEATSNIMIGNTIRENGGTVVNAPDPCLLPKACKNAVELQGMRDAHRRDGAAIVRFLKWVEDTVALSGTTEMDISNKMREIRSQNALFRDLSFDTISASSPNGAICHYRVSEQSSLTVGPSDILLVDSGGQYLDGTTDITRTMCFDTPPAHVAEHFTLVLKGHIQLAMARFPKGATGSHLDAIARMPLWRAGLDFDHGTGHGVGSYLNVHEGPQRISKAASTVALMPGMILSNEPGYYAEGEYGIRIENLVAVRPSEKGSDFYEFETLTLAPIDPALIRIDLLDDSELSWMNEYHKRVLESLSPLLDEAHITWLKAKTRPLDRD